MVIVPWAIPVSMKNTFFFVIRKFLDEYLILTRKPVSIYARINDIGRNPSKNQNLREAQQNFEAVQEECKTAKMPVDLEKQKNVIHWQKTNTGTSNKPMNTFLCSRVKPNDYIQWFEKNPEITDGIPGSLQIDLTKCGHFK